MKIRKLTVEGLNDTHSFSLNFNDDLNLLTGRNGSGKTTILKLLWFAISGNSELITDEINVDSATIETSEYTIRFARSASAKPYEWSFQRDGKFIDLTSDPDLDLSRMQARMPQKFRHRSTAIAGVNRTVLGVDASTLFFPTFRRIEGGFSLSAERRFRSDALEGSLHRLSDQLTNGRHRFVASISTDDIVLMLAKNYADASERVNDDHRRQSSEITSIIRSDNTTESKLESIQASVDTHSQQQETLLRPFTSLSKMVEQIFQHKGIEVTPRLALGNAGDAIASSALSAGEKQMLSFLAYNAFESESCIFIDEPEISLHVDWQRRLFPELLNQGSSNQFIVATHSPFIYSKYADKELTLNLDRGDSEV